MHDKIFGCWLHWSKQFEIQDDGKALAAGYIGVNSLKYEMKGMLKCL